MSILAFICYLVVAGICAVIARRLVPGSIPGGFIAAMVLGVIGGWAGGNLIGQYGPSVAGVSLLPCVFGSAVLILAVSLLGRRFTHSRI